MTATAALEMIPPTTIARPDLSASILVATGRDTIAIREGAVVQIGRRTHAFDRDTPIRHGTLMGGRDYDVVIDEATGEPVAALPAAHGPIGPGVVAGFHLAPFANASGRAGGEAGPAINPFSCWDVGFRPACPDPRGMALVDGRFWADIYLLGVDHDLHGTSRCGATIADGRDRPNRPAGDGRFDRLDYETAVAIYRHHGKGLLGAEGFFAAAHGVQERQSRDDEPKLTGETGDGAQRFVSRHGLVDAAGTMWIWGTDGDPDQPRPSLFGGSWFVGSGAGSRYASLDSWPGRSDGDISARGRSDHLQPE